MKEKKDAERQEVLDNSVGKYLRKIRASYMAISVVYVVFGVLLLINPDITLTICYGIGIVMIVYGAVTLLKFFTSRDERNYFELNFILGIIAAIIGIVIVVKPGIIVSILPFVLGIVIVVSSIVKLQDAVNLRRMKYEKWNVVLIFAFITLALGLFMVFNPLDMGLFLMRFIGICFIVDGAFSIASSVAVGKRA